MQFDTRGPRFEVSMNLALASVAIGFHRPDAMLQLIHALHPPTQAGSLKDANLDFGHAEAIGMFGRVVKLQAAQNPPGLLGRKGVVERSRHMGIQIILYQPDHLRLRIDDIEHPAQAVGITQLGALLGEQYMAASPPRVRRERTD